MADRRWYWRLLGLLPGDFRSRHGDEALGLFEERLNGATSAVGRVGVWLGAIWDVVTELLRQRLTRASAKPRGHDPLGGRNGGVKPHKRRSRPAASTLFEQAVGDARYGLRGMIRNPVFSVVAIVTLALGVGVNVSIFSLANEILLRPLPIPDSDRLVDLLPEVPGGNSFLGFSLPDFREYRSDNQTLLSIAATSGIALEDGESGRSVSAAAVTADYFDVMGVRPVVGNPFTQADAEAPGGRLLVLLSDAYWRESLGGRRDIVGTEVTLEDVSFEVAGVMPPGFRGRHIGFPMDLWVPLRVIETIRPGVDLSSRNDTRLEAVARRRPGAEIGAVSADLERVAESLRQRFPDTNRGVGIHVYQFTGVDHSLRGGVIGFLGLLSLLAGMVLLIACLNVGSMLLSRASARTQELGLRSALGATRSRITSQLLTETLVLFGVAAVCAVGLATAMNGALRRYIDTLPVPLGVELAVDTRVVGFALFVAFVSSLIAGLTPSRGAAGIAPATVLGRRDGGASLGASRFRGALVVVQVAISVVLLAAAGGFLQSVKRGRTFDPGLDVARLAVAAVGFPEAEANDGAGLAMAEQLKRDLELLEGVESVAFADAPPIGVSRRPVQVEIPGLTPPVDQVGFVFDRSLVSWNYVAVTGLNLLRGRDFQALDQEGMAEPVLINRMAWETFWPEQDPVGRQVAMAGVSFRIVGVVENTRAVIQDRFTSPRIYGLLGDASGGRATIIMALNGDLSGELQRNASTRLTDLLPNGAASPLRTLDDVLEVAVLPQRAASGVTGALGFLGLLLAAVGLYGVIAFGVSQRRREFGIRMSLGELPRGIFYMAAKGGLKLLLIGVGVGTLGALALFPVMQRLLAGLEFRDMLGAAAFIPVVVAAGLVAAGVPAIRALATDPVTELRAS